MVQKPLKHNHCLRRC